MQRRPAQATTVTVGTDLKAQASLISAALSNSSQEHPRNIQPALAGRNDDLNIAQPQRLGLYKRLTATGMHMASLSGQARTAGAERGGGPIIRYPANSGGHRLPDIPLDVRDDLLRFGTSYHWLLRQPNVEIYESKVAYDADPDIRYHVESPLR